MPAAENNLQELSQIPGLEDLSKSGPNPETDAALDGLLKEVNPTDEDKVAAEEKAAEEAAAKEKEAAEAKAKEEAEAKSKADAELTPEQKTEAEAKAKVEADAKAAEETAHKAQNAKDGLDDVQLPPYTKGATTAAFDRVKQVAREKIAAHEKTLSEVQAKLKILEEKGNGKLDPAIEKELVELRKFRSQIDVEADPVFKSYDQKIEANNASIFSKLIELKTPDTAIEKIKAIGVDKVDWDNVKMDSVLRRFIETKLATNIELADQKKSALDSAKKNAEQYLKTRQDEIDRKNSNEAQSVEKEIASLAKEFPWMAERTAKPGEEKAVEGHNKSVRDIREMMKEAVENNTPQMRALLAIGTAQFVNLRTEHNRIVAEHKTELAAKDAAIATAKKELEAATALLDKVKNNSTSRLRESPAVPKDGKPVNPLTEQAGDALDRLARENGIISS